MSGLSANVSLGQPVVPVPGAVGGAPGPDEQSFRQELAVALGQLPPEQRAVVHLKLWEGETK